MEISAAQTRNTVQTALLQLRPIVSADVNVKAINNAGVL